MRDINFPSSLAIVLDIEPRYLEKKCTPVGKLITCSDHKIILVYTQKYRRAM